MEPTRLRSIRGFAIGILAGLVLASAGVASAKQGGGLGPSSEVISLVADEPDLTDACVVEEAGASDDAPDLTTEGDESERPPESESDGGESEESDEDCPAVEEEQESGEEEPAPATESGDRQAECEEAAGLSEGSDDVPDLTSGDSEEGSGGEEEVKGLDHAIEVVLANCVKNPQAPGLLNALRHLAENRERKMAHDEAKAERKAAHVHGNGHKP